MLISEKCIANSYAEMKYVFNKSFIEQIGTF